MASIGTTNDRRIGIETALERLVNDLHSRDRLRVWSIIITIFGDAVVPRGGTLWAGSLQAIADKLNVAPGAVRAALSRLAADGWLRREKSGRQSYYQLVETGKAEFETAAKKIYGVGTPEWNGNWDIILSQTDVTPSQRSKLQEAGFAHLQPRLFLRPQPADQSSSTIDSGGLTHFSAETSDMGHLRPWLAGALKLEELGQAYQRHYLTFSQVLETISTGKDIPPADAMAIRTLLVHSYRRIVLKDPCLPRELLPQGWPGIPSRQLTIDLYGLVLAPSEAWLDRCRGVAGGELPAPDQSLFDRFGGVMHL